MWVARWEFRGTRNRTLTQATDACSGAQGGPNSRSSLSFCLSIFHSFFFLVPLSLSTYLHLYVSIASPDLYLSVCLSSVHLFTHTLSLSLYLCTQSIYLSVYLCLVVVSIRALSIHPPIYIYPLSRLLTSIFTYDRAPSRLLRALREPTFNWLTYHRSFFQISFHFA